MSGSDLHRDALGVVMASFAGPAVPPWLADAVRGGLGSVCLFASNLGPDDGRARALTEELHAACGPGLPGVLVALDEEGGDVTRLDSARGSDLPAPAALGVADDVPLTRAVAAALGRRLRAVGVDLDLAPVADVDADPRNPVIGVRSVGADAALVARHVAAAVEELQAAGVAACVKHFPGHGDVATDSHLGLPELAVDAATLQARELVPFRAAIAAGVEAVMSGHLRVPALDPVAPASTSAAATALLRESLGFTGVLVTDALDMAGVSGPAAHGSLPAAAVAALAAGADLLCLGADKTAADLAGVVTAIGAAVADGRLPAQRLAEAAGRVRALATRAAARRAAAPPAVTGDGGLAASAEVARRALRVTGTLPPTLAGALVVRFSANPSIAVGPVPWGLADVAGAAGVAWPGAEFVDAAPGDDLDVLLARAAGRPLVAVVRDAARTPALRGALDHLHARRPDVVVVELGRPAGPLPGGAVVTTSGASRSSAWAAVELLTAAR